MRISPISGSPVTRRWKATRGNTYQPVLGAGAARHQDHAAIELVKFAGELALAVDRDSVGKMPRSSRVEDLDAARLHEEEIDPALTPVEQ